jgi:hypothetical protein
VSGQLQGHELTDLWQRHLGTDKLFREVDDLSRRLSDAAFLFEQG